MGLACLYVCERKPVGGLERALRASLRIIHPRPRHGANALCKICSVQGGRRADDGFCYDYHGLNAISRPAVEPLPYMDALLDFDMHKKQLSE